MMPSYTMVSHPGLPFIQKPFSPLALRKKVREVLGGKQEGEIADADRGSGILGLSKCAATTLLVGLRHLLSIHDLGGMKSRFRQM